jgi:hypothetical protein
VTDWTRELPNAPGIFDHRNLENAKGRVPIRERVMFVGYANWSEDSKLGHGTRPTDYIMPPKLRAVRIEHPMTADSLTVQEWGGEWRRLDTSGVPRTFSALDRTLTRDEVFFLIDALRRQRQVDEDGTEVGVSREAVDHAASLIERHILGVNGTCGGMRE